jgi:hypothetical protein
MRTRHLVIALSFVAATLSGRAQEASTYALTPAAAEKFVQATQQLVTAWEGIMFVPAEWQGICESAQRSLRE